MVNVLKIYVENRQWEECISYISQINENLDSVDHMVKTGNVMADAIINSKISLAKSKNIKLDVTAKVPEELPISDVEFCIIFGNLMDNAIEACEKIFSEEKRFIRIYIGIFKKQFYISVTNATNQKKGWEVITHLRVKGMVLGCTVLTGLLKNVMVFLTVKMSQVCFQQK